MQGPSFQNIANCWGIAPKLNILIRNSQIVGTLGVYSLALDQ
jgi:hypothetical protein